MTVLQGATPQWRWCFWAAGAGFALRLLIAQMPPVSRSSTNRWWRHGKYPFHPQKHLPQSLPETRLLDEIWNTERKGCGSPWRSPHTTTGVQGEALYRFFAPLPALRSHTALPGVAVTASRARARATGSGKSASSLRAYRSRQYARAGLHKRECRAVSIQNAKMKLSVKVLDLVQCGGSSAIGTCLAHSPIVLRTAYFASNTRNGSSSLPNLSKSVCRNSSSPNTP